MSMGRMEHVGVKDIYFHQTQGGDEFVGRCAAMLNMFNGDFACSPAFFEGDDTEMRELADAAVVENFPHHHAMDGMKRVLHRCLAAMVFHRNTILNLPPNHIARSIMMFCQLSPAVPTNVLANHCKIIHSWETNTSLSGIPPHIKSLVNIAAIRMSQDKMVDQVYERVITGVKDLLDTRQIGGGELTEVRLHEMVVNAVTPQVDALNATLNEALHQYHHHPPVQDQDFGEQLNQTYEDVDGTTHQLRLDARVLTRLPENFEFPQAGVYDCWIKWNIKDSVRGIPPLKKLHPQDYAFLDSKPKPGGGARRASRKTFCDLKCLCTYIEDKATEEGMDPSNPSPANIRLIYEHVWPTIYEGLKGGRSTQNRWMTLVDKFRKKKKREKEELEMQQQSDGAVG